MISGYWDQNVSNWKVASHLQVGTQAFFREVERYRFEKLDYLPAVAGFERYAGKKVLDIGCGLGTDTARFASHGANVTGIDISNQAIELAKKNFEWRGLQGRFQVMNGEALDLPSNAFDFVYCHTVLHFTPSPEDMVHEVHRVLKPGAAALLMMINRRSWLYFLHRIAGVKIDYMDAPVFHKTDLRGFRELTAPFPGKEIRLYRFPKKTEVHTGWKAAVYNTLFVDLFHALPARLTRNSGYHMLAFVRKPDSAG
ncbi:class I SAM-dependent methyltransferase [Leisingera sp. XS_AS12]|uniref:class I SAM-dependent methyltransferase n=1 Tax=Leisingera sp. XS_AS12 TaxID=3241294 RepID=UPI0035147758